MHGVEKVRAYLPSYEMKVAKTLAEALTLLEAGAGNGDGSDGGWSPFAGGTDLMVLFEAGRLSHKKFVSIFGIPELKGVMVHPDRVEIGAAATYSEIQKNQVIRKEFPNLIRSSAETGAIAIQNRGTLGGNIANASPAADSSPCLLVYGAVVELVSWSPSPSSAGPDDKGISRRTVHYRDFHLGYKKTALRPGELISKVILPRTREERFHFFRKVGTRKAQAISKICVAGVKESSGRLSLGFGSVGPVPILIEIPKGASLSECESLLRNKITPIDDIRSTAIYRLQVSLNLLADFLKEAEKGH
jgi:CO/xanthine dehydrogenase FAD-binding subunit